MSATPPKTEKTGVRSQDSRDVSATVRANSGSGVLYGVAALLAFTAIWMSLSRFERGHNADSIVPILVSLQHWTPFFWETNRYGMLLPLLAIPFRNPLTNLIVQTALSIGAGLAASFLLVRYLFDDSPFWLSAAALQNIWLFLLVPRYTKFDWFVVQCYGVSLALAFAALLLVRKQRFAWALLLMFLSHWVNTAAFILLVPLILQRHWIDREKRGLLASLAVVIAAAAGGFALSNTVPFQTTTSGFAPISTWAHGLSETIHISWGGALTHPILGFWIVIPAALGLVALAVLRTQKRTLLVCLALANTALLYWLFTDTLAWVRENLYGMRYVYPSILLVMIALALLAIAPFETVLAEKKYTALVATSAMFLAALIGFGWPSAARIQRDFHRHFGSMTADIIASGAPVISGDYWTVWPAVFDVTLALYQQGEHRKVYGLTYRGTGTSALWSARNDICIDTPHSDLDAKSYMRDTGRHFQLTREFNTLTMYCQY